MKTPPSELHYGTASTTFSVENGDDNRNTHFSCILEYCNSIHEVSKVSKKQLVSSNGDTICCNSNEGDQPWTYDIASITSITKTKSKALCIHIRENRWFDTGNIISMGTTNASLSKALENISLVYSPSTKQLYSLNTSANTQGNYFSRFGESIPLSDTRIDIDSCSVKEEYNSGNHRPKDRPHNLVKSCSSVTSSLNDCSTSSNFFDSEANQIALSKSNKLWSLNSSFFKNAFSWKIRNNDQQQHKSQIQQQNSPQKNSPSRNLDKIGGSLALIQQCRPANLPAKNVLEEQNHRRQYDVILEAARKREHREERERRLLRQIQLREEERLAEDSQTWNMQVLPRFELLKNTRKVRELWWRGLPPSIRGQVWKLAIPNSLNVTSQLYNHYLERAMANSNSESLAAIKLDVSRTFPTLCVFQDGGPLSENLQGILAAYALYRPDISYVQGMSFIAAILSLNMETSDAFICFANLLNHPCHLAAFTLDQRRMTIYYKAYSSAFSNKLPKLYTHFKAAGLSPDLYLLDWLYTIYAKAMPLDIVCRIWDVFLRDGEEFLFRTALGVLHLYQEHLLNMDFLRGAQFLTKLPENMQADALFNSIKQMSTFIGITSFEQKLIQISADV